ncbi:hypothetical protein ATANTOWER_029562 [Ataeniobius toweri]|uniref:Secreted protein n=1 Tax=Ataeniobius toweri TaxID=208326 RepID=A0ABU7A2W6_9TELE|nr:hypothetical protein [Ataeniobius toweri]
MCVSVCMLLLYCVCVWGCENERGRALVCLSVATHSGVSVPQGTTLKICGSSSLLVSEQRLSALSSIAVPAALPPLSFVTPVSLIPPSITTLFQNMAPWRTCTHKLRTGVSLIHFQ